MKGHGSEARGTQSDIVSLRRARAGASSPTALVAFAVAARGLERGTEAVRRGRTRIQPARRVVAAARARVPRPEWLCALEAEGAERVEAARRDADRLLTSALGRVADQLLARLDVAALVLNRVDVDAIVEDAIAHADLDAAAARLDVEAVVDRIDLTRIVLERVDLRAVALALLQRLDLTGIVLDGVDLATVVAAAIDRTDLDALTATVIQHVDLDAAAARLDVEAVIDRLDLTRIVLERVDLDTIVDTVLSHLDLVAIAGEVIDGVDLPEIIRESTGSMASDTVRGARMQGIHADEVVERAVDRLLLRRRRGPTDPMDPVGPVGGPADGAAPS